MNVISDSSAVAISIWQHVRFLPSLGAHLVRLVNGFAGSSCIVENMVSFIEGASTLAVI